MSIYQISQILRKKSIPHFRIFKNSEENFCYFFGPITNEGEGESERTKHFNRHRENNGGIVLGGDAAQRLQMAQLQFCCLFIYCVCAGVGCGCCYALAIPDFDTRFYKKLSNKTVSIKWNLWTRRTPIGYGMSHYPITCSATGFAWITSAASFNARDA